MTYQQFRELVFRMRTLQLKYFETRNTGILRECKNAEREVDAALESKLEGETKQMGLFGHTNIGPYTEGL